MSFGPDHYVPVLKSKQGERQALGQIAENVKAKISPLVEIDDIAMAYPSGQAPHQARNLDEHCDLNIDPLADTWGTNDLMFIDPVMVSEHQSSNGSPGTEYSFQRAAAANLEFVPVTGLRRPAADVAAAVSYADRGICLRLDDEDLGSGTLNASIGAFLAAHKKSAGEVDIVMDLSSITGQPMSRVRALSVSYLTVLPQVNAWRTVTVTASAFPDSMGSVDRGTSLEERTEWLAWLALYQNRSSLPRLATFGDYGIQHPHLLDDYDPRFMPASANIRYTLDDRWLILKGQSLRAVSGQFTGLAQQLVNDARYMQQAHCDGCQQALRCAQGATGYGSSSPWRRIGTVHHITHVATQIGQLSFP